MYDYIVVGAGIYGKIMAYLLSKDLKKILLIEKKEIKKRNKLDNVFLNLKDYKELEDLLDLKLNTIIDKKISNITINNINIDINALLINNRKLDNILLDLLNKNNVEIMDKVIPQKYDFKNNKLIIEKKEYFYKNLIGADGTLSGVRINLTNKIQRFKFVLKTKENKLEKNYIFNYDIKNKVCSKIIPTANSNLIYIINQHKKNKTFKSYNNLKEEYDFNSNVKTAFFLPDNDLLFKINNVFLIGDANGMIDSLSYCTFNYQLIYIKSLHNYFKYGTKINYRKIKHKIYYRKFINKNLFLPIISKFFLKLIIKQMKEDLC